MRDRNQNLSAERLEDEVKDALKRAEVIRDVLLKGNPTPAEANNSQAPPNEEPTNIS